MRILIATDAWRPQVNGVVSTLERMTQAALEFGAELEFLTPQGMWTAPLPSYPEIRLALPNLWLIGRQIAYDEKKKAHGFDPGRIIFMVNFMTTIFQGYP